MNTYKVKKTINLKNIATKEVEENAEKKLKKVRKKLSKLQDTMYAEGKYAALICLQGMDTSGKDSLIREVFKEVNARGVEVHSFKVPTENELKHDFMWRHYIALPAKGKIGVFNRTHYENVLVTRVHPEYVFSENIPSIKSIEDLNEDFYNSRMEAINNFENFIVNSGTIVLKFFLHLSKEEQKNRLLRRLRLKQKNWKFSPGDLKERKLWDNYQFCYQELLNKTSKKQAPWFVIPADDKPTARLRVAEIILENLKSYNFKEPELAEKYQVHLNEYRTQLENE
ncbi:polyphosphate:nucleotide phosphotransferase, PPK2 family [Lutibacter agarilyticus]|uniref:Polyphosphate:nucleotide phosphotransferase, PPK2 family n=1 Tax=Lutibacter agarilyticus TaxID=1109740 RepID=A0A238WZW5_9FLAO|nr:PPK2 family polyphosphate kinase [Lutibacter agarilyticus]SNR52106.1 polyphosphate:nucleotide phosphotransferase, PPK2 family [Lutibacter agarilyticus]